MSLIQPPYTSKVPFASHTYERKRYGYLWFEVRADGTGTTYVKFSNGRKLAGTMKVSAVVAFFNAKKEVLANASVSAEVSDLLPGASTKEKDVSADFALPPKRWSEVTEVGVSFRNDHLPPDLELDYETGDWTFFTW